MDNLFKIGDKVMISPRLCNTQDLREFNSLGTIGNIYRIKNINDKPYQSSRSYKLEGSNWHLEEWLVLVPDKNVIGGELL